MRGVRVDVRVRGRGPDVLTQAHRSMGKGADIMANTALAGATHGIGGGQQLVPS